MCKFTSSSFTTSDWWKRSRAVALIWFSSAFLFFLILRMASQSSSYVSDVSYSEQRSKLYDNLARDLQEKGPAFLSGATSQSLSLSDIFTLKDGVVTPVLKPANPPVRANVLHLGPEFAEHISHAVRDIFLPYFDQVIWFQNTSFFHSSMFHASSQTEPVPATENEVEAEANAVKAVAETFCPLKIVLDRVVLTSTGVLLGCWQVSSGTDPYVIREKLRDALPNAPKKQLYDPVILYTSLARLLGSPKIPSEEMHKSEDQVKFFYELVGRLNKLVQGFQIAQAVLELQNRGVFFSCSPHEAVVSELWYVEEFDVLALALNGRMKVRSFHLGCSGSN